jgi:hypothetical protein
MTTTESSDKAASDKTAEGKAAYSALMTIDLADNPQNYIKLRTGLDKKGRLKAEISNPTPRNVKDIVIGIQYRDSSGRIRNTKLPFKGVLAAGRKEIIDLSIDKFSKNQLANFRFSIIGARLAK